LEQERQQLQDSRDAEGDLRETLEEALIDRELADQKAQTLQDQVGKLNEKLQELEIDKQLMLEEMGQSRIEPARFLL
jgi:hypothetical protein